MMNFGLFAKAIERGLNKMNCNPGCNSRFNAVYSFKEHTLHIFNTRFYDDGSTEQDHVELPLQQFEDRVADLERNVGAAMEELGLNAITTREASGNYRAGMNKHVKMINSAIAEPTSVDMLKGEIRGLQIANDMLETENKQLKKMIEDLIRMKP